MICKNCNTEISEKDGFCPVCNVYINVCQVATREIRRTNTYVLVLDNGKKFDIQPEVNTKITIGRADLTSQPDIDLGPYDDGPYISRIHGEFFDTDGVLFYRSLGKNVTAVNNRKLTAKDSPVQIHAGDKICFVNVKATILSSREI